MARAIATALARPLSRIRLPGLKPPGAPAAPLSGQARDLLAINRGHAAGFAVKAGAVAGAAGVAGLAGKGVVDSLRRPQYTLEENVRETPEGTWVTSQDGQATFVPNREYLDAQRDRDQVLDLPIHTVGPSEAAEVVDRVMGAVTSPWTVLAAGAIIVGVAYVRRRG